MATAISVPMASRDSRERTGPEIPRLPSIFDAQPQRSKAHAMLAIDLRFFACNYRFQKVRVKLRQIHS